MNKSNLLANLAIAGIAAGMISVASVSAEETAAPAAVVKDSNGVKVDKKAKHHKHKDAAAPAVVPPDAAAAPAVAAPAAAAAPAVAAAPAADKHACKGMNSCKGKGGCKMDQADIDAAAKKTGMAVDKAGKAHDCKTKNECKGLGGCKGA